MPDNKIRGLKDRLAEVSRGDHDTIALGQSDALFRRATASAMGAITHAKAGRGETAKRVLEHAKKFQRIIFAEAVALESFIGDIEALADHFNKQESPRDVPSQTRESSGMSEPNDKYPIPEDGSRPGSPATPQWSPNDTKASRSEPQAGFDPNTDPSPGGPKVSSDPKVDEAVAKSIDPVADGLVENSLTPAEDSNPGNDQVDPNRAAYDPAYDPSAVKGEQVSDEVSHQGAEQVADQPTEQAVDQPAETQDDQNSGLFGRSSRRSRKNRDNDE